MNINERRQIWKSNHLKALESIGFNGSFRYLRTLENRARYLAAKACNQQVDEKIQNAAYELIESAVKSLFGGNLPAGFFINEDARGFALKIDNELVDLPNGIHRDFGGYGILAPDFSTMN